MVTLIKDLMGLKIIPDRIVIRPDGNEIACGIERADEINNSPVGLKIILVGLIKGLMRLKISLVELKKALWH